MFGRKRCRREVLQRTVRSALVVVESPSRNRRTSDGQVLEPMIVEAFIPKATVGTLDESVLRWLPRRDQCQLHTMLINQLVKRVASELGALIGWNRAWTARERDGLIEHASDIQSWDAVIDQDVDRLLGEVIHDREAFETTPALERPSQNPPTRPGLVPSAG